MKFEDIKVGKWYTDSIRIDKGTSFRVLYKDDKGLLVENPSGRRYTMPSNYDYSYWKEGPQKIMKWVFCEKINSEYVPHVYSNYVDAFDGRIKIGHQHVTTIKEIVFDVP